MADINSRLAASEKQLLSLESELAKLQASNVTIASVSRGASLPSIRGPPATKSRRNLKGHFGKVVDFQWGGDGQSLVSASQDGKLLLWNAVTTSKRKAISLKSNYVMGVGIEQTQNNLVACGGLDNLCSLYKWSAPETAILEMASHDGYVSCCRFRSTTQILTSSGDGTIIQWDLTSGRVMDCLEEHKNDVMRLSISPTDPNTIVSCSVDKTAKVWDMRSPKSSVQTFVGHQADIDGVEFMSNGLCFGTASEDGTARIYDLRSYHQVAQFGSLVPQTVDATNHGLTSITFSGSGRVLFAGHANGSVLAWDVLRGTTNPAFELPHEKHVSCVGVNPKGDALCTGSWDTTLKIWA